MSSTDRLLAAAAGLSAVVLVGFVTLPLVSVFVRIPPTDLLAQLRSLEALEALGVSLRTTLASLAVIVVLGTPTAYLLGRRRTPGPLVSTVLELPLVLPPAVAGIALFAAFGRSGLLGGYLGAVGISIPFTQVAVVMAQTFVALPFYLRQAVASFASVDPDLLGASRTLGAGAGRTFLRIAVPVAAPGLSAGAALAWARALGEFGATILFAGSLRGVTQTLPLAVYEEFAGGDPNVALALSALLVAVSAALLVGVKLLVRGRPGAPEVPWIPSSRSTSTTE